MGKIRSKMHISLYAEYPLFLSDFNETNFLDRFSKNTQIQNFMKIRPVGIELLHEERQTWRSQQSLFAIFRTPHKLTNFKPFRRCCVRNSRAARIGKFKYEVSRKIVKLVSQSVTTVTSSRCPTQRAYTELNKTGKCTHKRIIEARSCNNFCSRKALILHTLSVCL